MTPNIERALGAAVLTREERFYETASREVEDGTPLQALWGKAFALAAGEQQKAQALYLGLRVEQLERKYQDTVGDYLRSEAPQITGGLTFICPFCERRSVAVRKDTDFFVRAFTDAPAVRYQCKQCSGLVTPPPAGESGKAARAATLVPAPAGGAARGGMVNQPMALTGFILGLASIPFYVVGVIPLLGAVFSAIGLAKFHPEKNKNRWMGTWGLALSIIFALVSIAHYGRLR